MRKFQPDGICTCCGRIGPTWCDVVPADEPRHTVAASADEARDPPLCDACEYAQKRWDARQSELRRPTAGYPYTQGPPRTPPVRRPGDIPLAADGWPV